MLGTERHESRRIDNQLRGRAGTQGDPGSSRFYLSLEDDLLRIFGSERIQGLMKRLGMEEGEAIEAKMLSGAIERAQGKVEARNFDIRKHLLEYDDVMNKQRESIYAWRKEILSNEDCAEEYAALANQLIEEFADERLPERGETDPEALAERRRRTARRDGPSRRRGAVPAARGSTDREKARERLEVLAQEKLAAQQKMFDDLAVRFADLDMPPPTLTDIGRGILLQTLDELWKEHLLAMDHLKEGIGLRGYAGEDPKRAYQREGYEMFLDMERRIRERACEQMYKVALRAPSEDSIRAMRAADEARQRQRQRALQEQHAGASAVTGPQPGQPGQDDRSPQTVQRQGRKVGRNELCPCGSGKKYKKCCGQAA